MQADAERSRRGLLTERLRLIEQGHWGVLWTHAEVDRRRDDDAFSTGTEVRRVEQLLEAGELSRAASAVWGASAGVKTQSVRNKLILWRAA